MLELVQWTPAIAWLVSGPWVQERTFFQSEVVVESKMNGKKRGMMKGWLDETQGVSLLK